MLLSTISGIVPPADWPLLEEKASPPQSFLQCPQSVCSSRTIKRSKPRSQSLPLDRACFQRGLDHPSEPVSFQEGRRQVDDGSKRRRRSEAAPLDGFIGSQLGNVDDHCFGDLPSLRSRERQMDSRGKDVAQLVKVRRALVGDDRLTPRPKRPANQFFKSVGGILNQPEYPALLSCPVTPVNVVMLKPLGVSGFQRLGRGEVAGLLVGNLE